MAGSVASSGPGLLAAELEARRRRPESAFMRAVWSLVAGEPEAGLRELRQALDEGGRGVAAAYRAEIAALLDDWPAASGEARAALPDATRFVPGWREYRAAMLALFADDDTAAAASVDALDAIAGARDKLRSRHPSTVAAIPRGLLRRDAGDLERGIEALLAWHLRRARTHSEVFNSANGVISLDAIAALLLAHHRGVAVAVAATYRKAKVPLLVIHLDEWNGQPLPRAAPLTLETDLVAGAWLRGRGLADGVGAGDAGGGR